MTHLEQVPIGAPYRRRLRALPMAALCLPCQYEQESACRRPASMESVVRRGTTS